MIGMHIFYASVIFAWKSFNFSLLVLLIIIMMIMIWFEVLLFFFTFTHKFYDACISEEGVCVCVRACVWFKLNWACDSISVNMDTIGMCNCTSLHVCV